jgi:cytochrome c biogenesis protein CcdA
MAGVVCSYGSLAVGLSLLAQIAAYRTITERALAVALIFAGCAGLLAQKPAVCGGVHEPSLFGTFGLGVAMGFLISPCCSPIVLSLAAMSFRVGIWQTAVLLMAFAAGQLLPSCVMALAPQVLRARAGFVAWREPMQIGTAILSLCLGGYYALLSI